MKREGPTPLSVLDPNVMDTKRRKEERNNGKKMEVAQRGKRKWMAERRLLRDSTAEPHDDLGLELPRHGVGLGREDSRQ